MFCITVGLISPSQFERDVSSPHFTSYFANLFILFVVHRHQSSSSACLWCGWHLRWNHRGPGNQIQASWVTGPFRLAMVGHLLSNGENMSLYFLSVHPAHLYDHGYNHEIFLAGVKRNEILRRKWSLKIPVWKTNIIYQTWGSSL